MRAPYEKPTLMQVGTVQDLTLAANNNTGLDFQFDAATGQLEFGSGGLLPSS